jgi:hypothetical protein
MSFAMIEPAAFKTSILDNSSSPINKIGNYLGGGLQ